MSRALAATHYLIMVPIVGLLIAAGLFVVHNGIGLVRQLIEEVHGIPPEQVIGSSWEAVS
jgi:hypothetical protein